MKLFDNTQNISLIADSFCEMRSAAKMNKLILLQLKKVSSPSAGIFDHRTAANNLPDDQIIKHYKKP